MLFGIRPSKASDRGWIYEKEVQYTSNKEAILQEIKRLIKEGTWVEIRTPGYRSPPTVIVAADKSFVQVDKPIDWRQASDIVLGYREKGKPWNFMGTRVKGLKGDSLYLNFPTLWAILERREYFRISCPPGSAVKCYSEKFPLLEGNITDISLGGVGFEFVSKRGASPPKQYQKYNTVSLILRLLESKDIFTLDVKKGGEVRRISIPGRYSLNIYRIGMRLFMDREESEELSVYIRRRELEILRILNRDKS